MKKYIKLVCVIFVASCAINTPSKTKAIYDCDIIYGHATDWENISDDLARNIYEHNLKCEIFND